MNDVKRNFDKNFNYKQTIEILENKLKFYKPKRLIIKESVPAAVMILFLEIDSKPYILFTKRTEDVEHHKGQISFPGGSKDVKDETFFDTAIRETYEEIGVSFDQIQLVGESDEFYTNTNFLVRPFVGILKPPYNYSFNQREVAEIVHVPLSIFFDRSKFEIKAWQHAGRKYDVYFYYYNNQTIWGVTGFLINRLIQIVFNYVPAPNPTE